MRIFSIHQDDAVLCDSPTTYADLRRYRAGDMFGRQSRPRVETILCAVEGGLYVGVADRAPVPVRRRQAVHIPAGVAWAASAGPQAVKVLRVDSLHPGFDPAQALMPALADIEARDIADGLSLTFTDYVRSRVLNFAPGFAADKHFHQGADELFWFYRGTARVITPDQDVALPEDSVIINPAGEWHVIANGSADQPLLMFLTVTPNVTPSHTFFDAGGHPVVRSLAPLTRP
jgi:mannose-6-phosphate isomerase-like protein (cupin superfamily)